MILGRQQLFTETTLTVIIPLLSKQTLTEILGVLRIWSVILAAYLAGTFIFALCIAVNHSRNARAKPIIVDPRDPNGGDDHDRIFGESRADAGGQEPQPATPLGFGILGESKKRARKLS